jgi:hypothetical protein
VRALCAIALCALRSRHAGRPTTRLEMAGRGVDLAACGDFESCVTQASHGPFSAVMRSRSAVLGRVGVLALSCGGIQSSSPPDSSPPAEALAAWTDFPADRIPRPIILLEDITPGLGFSDGDGKLAFMCGRFAAATPLPSTTPARAHVTWGDRSDQTFTAISASDAYVAMAANARGKSPDCATVPPLTITQTRLGTETYETDRGQAQITSWLFTAPDA